MTGFGKNRAQQFWRELQSAASAEAAIAKYKGKAGWPKKRTLERYALADQLFRQGTPFEQVAAKTGLSVSRVAKVQTWWSELYPQVASELSSTPGLTPPVTAQEQTLDLDEQSRGARGEPSVEATQGDQQGAAKEAHLQDLLSLAGRLRDQLTIPLPYSRVGEFPVSKHDFLRHVREVPGGSWYWGWETDLPLLCVEMSPDNPLLREHTKSWDFWRELDALRTDLHSYVVSRDATLSDVETASRERTRLPVNDLGQVRGGSITTSFARGVYDEALREAAGEVPCQPRYMIPEDLEESVPPVGGTMGFGSTNFAFQLDGQTIAWLPDRDDSSVFAPPEHVPQSRLANTRRHLVDEWRDSETVRGIVTMYLDLASRAAQLSRRLPPGSVRKPLLDSGCPACP